jgi:hypothetical protein
LQEGELPHGPATAIRPPRSARCPS